MLKSAYREINMQWFCSQVHLLVGERGQNPAKLLLEQFIVSHFSCHRWWCIHPHLRIRNQLFIYPEVKNSFDACRAVLEGTFNKLQLPDGTSVGASISVMVFLQVFANELFHTFSPSRSPSTLQAMHLVKKKKGGRGCRSRHWQRSNGV